MHARWRGGATCSGCPVRCSTGWTSRSRCGRRPGPSSSSTWRRETTAVVAARVARARERSRRRLRRARAGPATPRCPGTSCAATRPAAGVTAGTWTELWTAASSPSAATTGCCASRGRRPTSTARRSPARDHVARRSCSCAAGAGGGVTGYLPTWYDPDDDRTARAAWSRLTEPGRRRGRRVRPAGRCRRGARARPARGRRRTGGRLPLARPAARTSTLAGDLAPLRGGRRPAGRARRRASGPSRSRLGDLAVPPICLWVRGPATPRCRPAAGRSRSSGPGPCTEYGEHGRCRVRPAAARNWASRSSPVPRSASTPRPTRCPRRRRRHRRASWPPASTGAYPRGNAPLLDRIAAEGVRRERGAAAVARPPGPGSSHRNRLIAALGRRHARRRGRRGGRAPRSPPGHAGKLNRPVGAVPGPITSPASAGCHRLLRDGCDMRHQRRGAGRTRRPARRRPGGAAACRSTSMDELTPRDLRVLDALPLRRCRRACTRSPGWPGSTCPRSRAGWGRLRAGGVWRERRGRRLAPRPRTSVQRTCRVR